MERANKKLYKNIEIVSGAFLAYAFVSFLFLSFASLEYIDGLGWATGLVDFFRPYLGMLDLLERTSGFGIKAQVLFVLSLTLSIPVLFSMLYFKVGRMVDMYANVWKLLFCSIAMFLLFFLMAVYGTDTTPSCDSRACRRFLRAMNSEVLLSVIFTTFIFGLSYFSCIVLACCKKIFVIGFDRKLDQ